MNVKIMYFPAIVFVLLFASCEDNPVGPNHDVNLLKLTGPTIIYTLVSDNFITNRVYNSGADKAIFEDDYLSSNIRISPENKYIAYVKNASIHPWYGYYTDGIPTVTVTTDMGKTEKKLLRADSSGAFFIDWISDDKIAVSSKEAGSFYLTIINSVGDILERKEVTNLYQMYMLPDGKHLVAYNIKNFGVLDVSTYDFQIYNPGGEISTWQTPFYTDSKFIFSSYRNEGYRLIEFDLSNNFIKILSLPSSNDRLVYADANNRVYYNISEKSLNLFHNGSQISSVILSGYRCSAGLSLDNENDFYFIGESSTVDDEGVLVKVDFSAKKITRLTNHGEDKFIVDAKFYNL